LAFPVNSFWRRNLAFISWFLLGCAATASMGAYHYPPWLVVLSGGLWLAAAVVSPWALPRHRTISLLLVLATSVAMRRTFLQMIWAVETILGYTTPPTL
jgi:hypothetical protein